MDVSLYQCCADARGLAPQSPVRCSPCKQSDSGPHAQARMTGPMSRTDAGVQHGIENIGRKIDEDVGQSDGEYAALDQRVIAIGDRCNRKTAYPGPTQNSLGNE